MKRLRAIMSQEIKRNLAQAFVKGKGIEIGPLHSAFPVPPGTDITYVDRLSESELRKQYPELASMTFTPGIIDDGETLKTFSDSSLDFVIASHFIEHTQNPINTLKNFNRVLKLDGVVLLVVPDRHATFDKERPPTSWEHVYNDYINGPESSYKDHLREWVTLVEHTTDVEGRISELAKIQYSIHCHVWNNSEFTYFLNKLIELMPFHVIYFQYVPQEMYAVLQKKEHLSRYSETVYLRDNPDVNNAVIRGEFSCGYEHWLKYGQYEVRNYPWE